MDVPNLFTAQDSDTQTVQVLCVILSEATVQALHVSVSPQEVAVKAASKAVAYTDSKQCVIQVDECLQQLGKESENISQVVFAINHDWIKGGDVAAEYKPLLRHITTELSLEPIGFVDETEAISQYFLSQNAAFSGIFAVIGVANISLAYLSQGEQKGIESVGRSADLKADITEGLARFSQLAEESNTYLPATLFLASFDTAEAELREYQQILLDADLNDAVRFLQMPTVQVITDTQYTQIVAHEAGKAAALAQGQESAAAIKPRPLQTQPANAASFGFNAVDPDDSTDPNSEPETKELPADTTEEADHNLTAVPESNASTTAQATQVAQTPAPATTASSFGIPIRTDVPDYAHEEPTTAEPEETTQPQASGFIPKLVQAWKQPYGGNKSKRFFAVMGLLIGLVVVLLSLLGYVYATASALVTLTLDKQLISKEVNITIDATATATDPESQVLAVDTVETTVSDSGSIPTTGVTIVGDKAKGTVTIFNKTTSQKTFAAGTVLRSGELDFTLDAEVTVASASVQEKTGGAETKYGQTDTSISAAEIGAESNLPEDTKLTIASFATDTYEAILEDEALTGGASREVRVVSEDDRTAVLSELRKTLLTTANEKLSEDASEDQYVLPSEDIVDQTPTFSAEVGEEANELELDLSITVRALAYTIQDLRPLAQAVLGAEVPEGYELDQEDPQILTDPTAEASSSAATKRELVAQVSSFAVPKLDMDALKQELAGQSVETVTQSVQNQVGVSKVMVQFTPEWISMFRSSLPTADRIQVTTTAE